MEEMLGYSDFLFSDLFEGIYAWCGLNNDAPFGSEELIYLYENGDLEDIQNATTAIFKEQLGLSHVVLYGVKVEGDSNTYDEKISSYYTNKEKAVEYADWLIENGRSVSEIFSKVVPVEDILFSCKFMFTLGNIESHFDALYLLKVEGISDLVFVVNRD